MNVRFPNSIRLISYSHSALLLPQLIFHPQMTFLDLGRAGVSAENGPGTTTMKSQSLNKPNFDMLGLPGLGSILDGTGQYRGTLFMFLVG